MDEAIPAGTTLHERYIVTQCVGAGAHARVYAGVDTHTSKAVALKVTHQRDPELLARFRREARISARLGAEAAGMVRCHGFHELPGGGATLVLDLIEGAKRLDLDAGSREARLDQLESLASVVAWLHERDVIHRDLKPSNVLSDGRGRLFLSDFGLAKELGRPEEDVIDAGLTRRHASLGTPAYMPLEQFQSARDVDHRADVYALGAMLFRTLAGVTPYRGDAVEVLSAQMRVRYTEAAPPRPSSFDVSIPPALNALCLAATELDPERRLPTASVFLQALRKARRGESPGGPAPSRRLSSGRITLDKLEVVVEGEARELAILRELGDPEAGLRRFDVVFERRSARAVLLAPNATRRDDRCLAHEAQLLAQLSGAFTWRKRAELESGLLLERPIDLPSFEVPWPPALTLDLGLDLLGALVELHELGFVHGALSPAACGLRGGSWSSLRELRAAVSAGESRLILGGFAQARSKAYLRRLAAGPLAEGALPAPAPPAPEYAAPERAQPGAELSAASDLYALGQVLSLALGPRLGTLPQGFGERLRGLLAELTHPDPEHRPGAEEARAILADLASAEPIDAHLLRQRAL